MKRILILLVALLSINIAAFGQAKKPVIMVVPNDSWCLRNGYVMEFDNMGAKTIIPDYERAFLENSEVKVMISAIADFMAQNDFPIQSLEYELKRLKQESAEMALMMGKNDGGMIVETPIERLRRSAKADIILNLDYTIRKMGPRKQIEYNLEAIDAYTSKIISGNQGTSSEVSTTASNTAVLQESVLSFKDNFIRALENHFNDLFTNGREVTVTLLRYDTCPIDFQEEFEINGMYFELRDIIDAWFSEKSVEGRYSMESSSANRLRFNQVRIPVYAVNPLTGKQTAIDASGFVRDLVNTLKRDPYNLVVGVTPKGLGEVWITIGDK
jgi:hypothetical protein